MSRKIKFLTTPIRHQLNQSGASQLAKAIKESPCVLWRELGDYRLAIRAATGVWEVDSILEELRAGQRQINGAGPLIAKAQAKLVRLLAAEIRSCLSLFDLGRLMMLLGNNFWRRHSHLFQLALAKARSLLESELKRVESHGGFMDFWRGALDGLPAILADRLRDHCFLFGIDFLADQDLVTRLFRRYRDIGLTKKVSEVVRERLFRFFCGHIHSSDNVIYLLVVARNLRERINDPALTERLSEPLRERITTMVNADQERSDSLSRLRNYIEALSRLGLEDDPLYRQVLDEYGGALGQRIVTANDFDGFRGLWWENRDVLLKQPRLLKQVLDAWWSQVTTKEALAAFYLYLPVDQAAVQPWRERALRRLAEYYREPPLRQRSKPAKKKQRGKK